MSGDDWARLAAGVMMMTLVVSSLSLRRMAPWRAIQLGLVWTAIFALAFVLFTFRDEGRTAWDRLTTEINGKSGMMTGNRLHIAMSDDGHFWVRGQVNDVDTDFLIDTGATTTALSAAIAGRARLVLDDIPVPIDTANGPVAASTTRITSLRVGGIEQVNARAVVSPAFGDTNVLGMSFLSSLRSWRVEGRTLILEP